MFGILISEKIAPLKIFTSLLITAWMVSSQATAQESNCGGWPVRSVSLNGIKIQASAGEAEGAGLTEAQYGELSELAKGLFNSLREEDPERQCLSFAEKGQDTMQLSSPENLDEDYVLAANIRKVKGGLVKQVSLQAVGSGEVVATAESNYDVSLSAIENGRMLAQQLIPLAGRIRDFERSRRDSDPDVVIGFGSENSGVAEILPEKESIRVKGEMKVRLRVMDCDGQPVRDMALELSAAGGTLRPEKVKTDEAGTAVTTYVAPCEPGSYDIQVGFSFRRPFEGAGRKMEGMSRFETSKSVRVEPGNHFHMHCKNSLSEDIEGNIVVNSEGKGIVACTIDWEQDPPAVTGTGMVAADWTGIAGECTYRGRSTFRVEYHGTIITGEDNVQWLEIRKTVQEELGGNFSIDCGSSIQEVQAKMPFPLNEEDRDLKFKLVNGAFNSYDGTGSDSHYSYSLEIGCK